MLTIIPDVGESLCKMCRKDCPSPQLRAPEIASPGLLCVGPLPGRHCVFVWASENNRRKEGGLGGCMWLGSKAGGGELGDYHIWN